ncbi:TPA: YjbH domain-containing protein [Vibrio vulnificus]|uniref:YjbH domain-containing protein n=1 Tax=Vibrio vulnificus TaxID=672 RepID=UPI0029E0687A|nr:YjbH domain-containing protein [Vibrio vulnificus]EHY1123453.1 YjbH domain-containing protein [Vibrio vulnificus]
MTYLNSSSEIPSVGFRSQVSAVCLSVLSALAGVTSLHSQASELETVTLRPSQTDFGGVGLMQMPSGRMAKEGEFNFGVNLNDDYHHYYTSLQLFDWFETTIRYTRIPDTLYNPNPDYSGDNLNTDKGIDIKFRLWQESYWLPETSIGIRDIGGTGLFDGEFIAGTKRFGPLDVTLGVGWGYIGQSGNISNPFCKVSEEYCDRDGPTKGTGGSVDFGRWFKGEASIYGGIEYQTPYQPLRLKVEYDANDYTTDYPVRAVNKPMPQHTPWNFGVLYQLGDWGDAKLSYQRGDTLTFGFNLYTNFDDLKAVWRDEPKQAVTGRPSEGNTDWQAVAQQLDSNAGYQQSTLYEQGDALVIAGEQVKYRDRKEAQDRAAAILANNAPDYITTYKIVDTRNGVDLTQTEFDAEAYKQAATYQYLGANSRELGSTSEPDYRENAKPLTTHRERWNAGISPVLAQSLGGPEAFYLFHLGFNTEANYWLTNNIEASGSIYVNLADNYDKFNYVEKDPHISNFAVPRVRTMFRSYVSDNPVRLNHMQLTWFAQPTQQVYTQMYGGYLETMFAGVGGEVLYRPLGKNWALGLDANLISQRDPDSWFATFDEPFVYYDGYDASNCKPNDVGCQAYVLDKGTTGQLSAYYMPQWSLLENTLFKVSAGKFLGGDNGVRVDFSKQFKSGMIVGAFATVTDLTTEEYGEGSYNKGFYISIPFDAMTIKPSTARGVFAWQPITRDGGQTLSRKYELFEVTNARSRWY